MNNNKGHVFLGLMYAHAGCAVVTVTAFKLAFMAIALAAIWHIPAWEKAKANHTEAIYQAQPMWPVTMPNTAISYKTGNSGNFTGGIDK